MINAFILSDLHANFWDCDFSNKEEIFNILDFEIPELADIIILAGDISECCQQEQGKYIQIIKAICSLDKPVILIKGNHENYRSSLTNSKYFLKSLSEIYHNLYYLDNDFIDLNINGDKIRFFGATLWTDFNKNDPMAMLDAKLKMNDFGQMIMKPSFLKFLPEDAYQEHLNTLNKLYTASQGCPKDHDFVVITHHSPILQASYNFRKKRNYDLKMELLDYSYASDLTEYIEKLPKKPVYWIFGHIHAPFEEEYLGIKFIANPFGYPEKYEKCLYQDPFWQLETGK